MCCPKNVFSSLPEVTKGCVPPQIREKVSQKNTSTKEQEMQRNNSSGNNRASRTVTIGGMSWAISEQRE